MRRLCDNGDGKMVHARGLCDNCYQRARYSRRLDRLPPDYTEWSWPGLAVSRYTWNGVPANELPLYPGVPASELAAVRAARKRRRSA